MMYRSFDKNLVREKKWIYTWLYRLFFTLKHDLEYIVRQQSIVLKGPTLKGKRLTCRNSRTFEPSTRSMVSYPDSWQNSKNIFPNICKISPASTSGIQKIRRQAHLQASNHVIWHTLQFAFLSVSLVICTAPETCYVTHSGLYLQQQQGRMFWHLHKWFEQETDPRYRAEPPSWKQKNTIIPEL